MDTPFTHPVDAALLAAVGEHATDLTRHVATLAGVSRQTAATHARNLVKAGYLVRSGTTRPTYALGPNRFGTFHYLLPGLAEDTVWYQDIAPLLANTPGNVQEIANYGLTEMVNNAIDHSGGKHLAVTVSSKHHTVALQVTDDGIGIFRKISDALQLPDDRLALLELAKGKFTTAPAEHTGEGVFFSSRVFDRFRIDSSGLVFHHERGQRKDMLSEAPPRQSATGTTVQMAIATKSKRTLKDVFDAFSSGPDEYSFAKTIVPVRLARIGNEHLISRSQAKRLMQRVDGFQFVTLDFADVTTIGQAFADQIFRVFALRHPDVELAAIHATPSIQQMIRRAEVARDVATNGK